MRGYWGTVTGLSRDVRLYLVTSALWGFTVFGGIYSVLLNLYLLRLGHGPEFIGLFNSVSLLAMVIVSLPAGALGARWDVRRAMILGIGLVAVGYGMMPLAEWLAGPTQAIWLLATSILAGVGVATYLVNSSPYLMQITDLEERNHVFSLQVALWPLAGFAGSLIGGLLPGGFAWLLDVSPDAPLVYRVPIWIAAGLLVPALLTLVASRPDLTSSRTTSISPGAMPLGIMALMALIIFLQAGGEGIVRTFFNVYLDEGLQVATAQIGGMLAVAQLLAVPAALAAPLLAVRIGKVRLITGGTVAIGLSILILVFVPHWLAVGIGFLLMLAMVSLVRPIFTVYVLESVAEPWRGTISGATSLAISLSWAASAGGGGYLIAQVGYPPLFAIGALMTFVGAGVFALQAHLRSRAPAPRDVLNSPVP
jgi:MFS family permease